MDARPTAFRLCLCLLAAALTACGGGGGGGASTLPPGPLQTPGSPTSSAPVPVAFTVAIPSPTTTSSAGRRTRYVSAGTKSIAVTYGTTRQVADCASTCSMTLQVTPGNVAFTVGLYDTPGAVGSLLSSGQTTATIVPGSQNIVKITFSGVVASVAVALGTAVVVAGTPATIPLLVTAKDAAGYVIVGTDLYSVPIALGDDDTSGATTLSTNSLSSPGATASVAYNGASNLAAAHISASVPGSGVAGQTATLSVQTAGVPTPPPGTVPKHVATWYYIDTDNINMKLNSKFMADHATYVEGTLDTATAFKAAGGKYVVGYIDAAYAAFCAPPFMPPVPQTACIGSVGKRVADESGFFHGASGARVHHYVPSDNLYQEALNVASAAARKAYHDESVDIATNQGGSADFLFADDIGGNFVGPDGTTMSGNFNGFDAPAVEMTTDAQWLAAVPGMLASSVRPQIINGVDSRTQMPAYNGALLDMPNVAGLAYEGCYADGDGVAGYRADRWTEQSNGLLATMQHHVIALCMMTAKPTPASRLYQMASWWMTYTEPYSVAAPLTPDANGITVVPEYDVVPRQPRTSPTTDIGALRAPNGAYVREFAACYQAGVSIGPCAAVVNPTASAVALPSLAGHYTSSLTVDDRDAYNGGTATWGGAVPAQLAPLSAVILR